MLKALQALSAASVGDLSTTPITGDSGELVKRILEAGDLKENLEAFTLARNRDGTSGSTSSRIPVGRHAFSLGDAPRDDPKSLQEAGNGILALRQA